MVAGVRYQEDLDVIKNNMLEAYDELLILYAGLYMCPGLCNLFFLTLISFVCLSSFTGFILPTSTSYFGLFTNRYKL
jgi:hypothetical protein